MAAFVDSLLQDARYAARALRSSPAFTFAALLSLALGIGANTAVFSLLNAVRLKTLPVQHPEELVVLEDGSWTNPIWEQIRDRQQAFEGALAWGSTRFNLAQGGETRFARGILASGSYFDVLGVKAQLGRVWTVGDDRRSCGEEGPLAVLSDGFWQSHYGGDAGVLGKSILLDGHPFTVIGVTPRGFYGLSVGESFDVATPICSEPVLRGAESALDARSYWWLDVMGRLAPDSTLEQAQASLRSIQPLVREATLPQNWPQEYLKNYLKDPFTLSPAGSGVSMLRTRYSRALGVLMAVVALVLLLACTNIANLMLARASTRRRELAVRASVGASRSRLLRQLLIESCSLGVAGAGVGIVFALWASRLLVSLLSTGTRQAFLDVSPDGRVLAFTAGVGMLTGILFGILPALRATSGAPNETLREMSRGGSGTELKRGMGRFLVAVQVGLSLVLLFGAALFIRSYTVLASLNPGFDRSKVLIVSADIRGTASSEEEARLAFYTRLLEAVRAVPGVRAAATSKVTPVSGSTWSYAIQVDGFEPQSERDSSAHYNYVSPDYFKTLGTPIVAGRDFNDGDTRTSAKVAVVNETLAAKFFGRKNPIGDVYRVRENTDWESVQIVGIVRDAKYRNLRDPAPPTAYAPMAQLSRVNPNVSISVRGIGDPASLRPAIVSAVGDADKDIALTFRTLESQVSDSLVQERLMATLSGLFGALALLVAAVGLSGLVSYSVSRRRAEIGIRAALGASPHSLVRLVLGELFSLTALGLLLGTASGLAAGRFVSSLLYGVGANDPPTLALSAALLSAVGIAAGFFPARRAARIDPVECLRAE